MRPNRYSENVIWGNSHFNGWRRSPNRHRYCQVNIHFCLTLIGTASSAAWTCDFCLLKKGRNFSVAIFRTGRVAIFKENPHGGAQFTTSEIADDIRQLPVVPSHTQTTSDGSVSEICCDYNRQFSVCTLTRSQSIFCSLCALD